MSYSTPPIANRLGYNRGWTFQLIPQNTNMPNVTIMVYLKSYFILKEYLRFYQINLLSFYIRPLTTNMNLIHLLVYKHIRYPRKKPHPVFIDGLNKQGYFRVLNVFEKQEQHRVGAFKSMSHIGIENSRQNTISCVQNVKLYLSDIAHFHNQNIKKHVFKEKSFFFIKRHLRFKPKNLVNFVNIHIQKLVKFKQKQDFVSIRHLKKLGISYGTFCTTLQDIQIQELIICLRDVVKALNHRKIKLKKSKKSCYSKSQPWIKQQKKIYKILLLKTSQNLVSKWMKKKWLLYKFKRLVQLSVKTRLRLAKTIMIYWKIITQRRNQFYMNFYGINLKSFLNAKLCVNSNKTITKQIWCKSKELLKNHNFAKQVIFSMLNLPITQVNVNKSNNRVYGYKHFLHHKNKLNKNLMWLGKVNTTVKGIRQNSALTKQSIKSLRASIPSQNFTLKKNIKRKKHIYKPGFNNKLQLNYLFESYLQNKCKLPSIVKVTSTSPNVWLKKMYNKLKSKPRLKRAAEGHFFKRLLFAFLNTSRYMAPQLIADLIAHELTIPRKHKALLRNINTLFDAIHSKYILGYKIVVDGKLNGVMKSTKQIIKFKGKDKMPVQEFHTRVLYALGVSRTYAGLFGVRVWLYY